MKFKLRSLNYLLLLSILGLTAQDAQRFDEDVRDIQKKYDSTWNSERPTILFTGSSSIRLWDSLEESFPEYQIVNTGFGGSHTSDLLVYLDELVLRYTPHQVFIYEGDNDIEGRKKPREIIKTTEQVVKTIKETGSISSIVLISAKPSIARWRLKGRYKRFNRKLKKLCELDPLLQFANVWDPMLIGKKLNRELFIEDGLHMNAQGYAIWYTVLKDFVKL